MHSGSCSGLLALVYLMMSELLPPASYFCLLLPLTLLPSLEVEAGPQPSSQQPRRSIMSPKHRERRERQTMFTNVSKNFHYFSENLKIYIFVLICL